MTYTATQLIEQGLRDIGCLRAGQHTSTDIKADGLAALNAMIDGWLLDKLMVIASGGTLFSLTAAKQQYKIGPSGPVDFIAARPTQIDEANLVLNDVTPNVRLPIELINVGQWADIRVQAIPSAIPLRLYYDKNFDPTNGWATLNLWPGPLKAYQLELFTWSQLQSFADLTTNYSFPPGYARAIQKNLAVEMAPMMEIHSKLARIEHPRRDMLERVERHAKEAKADVQNYNATAPLMACDDAYMGHGTGTFNYGIGASSRR